MDMSRESEYRRQAELCERMSRRSGTLEYRVAWLKLASKWLALIRPGIRRRDYEREAAPLSEGRRKLSR